MEAPRLRHKASLASEAFWRLERGSGLHGKTVAGLADIVAMLKLQAPIPARVQASSGPWDQFMVVPRRDCQGG